MFPDIILIYIYKGVDFLHNHNKLREHMHRSQFKYVLSESEV